MRETTFLYFRITNSVIKDNKLIINKNNCLHEWRDFFFNHMFISHKPKIQYEVNQKQWQQECFGNHINQEVTIYLIAIYDF